MKKRAYGCALLFILTIPLCLNGVDARKFGPGLESCIGTDGVGFAAFARPTALPLTVGFRLSLGFEAADYAFNDPSAALAVRWNFLNDGKLGGWVGAEGGGAWMNTGYDSFAIPFVALTSGISFRVRNAFSVFLEAGLRYGTLTRERSARLEFLETRYRETVRMDPFAVRAGVRITSEAEKTDQAMISPFFSP